MKDEKKAATEAENQSADVATAETTENKKVKKSKKRSLPKFLLKFFLWLIGIVLLLVVALVLIAEFAHDKVVKLALPSVESIIDAPVNIGRTSLSFIRAFPYTTLELDDVYLGSSLSDSTRNDSLVKVDKIYISLKSEPLKDGIIEITEVEFKGATLKYLVDSTGATCFDFLMGGVQDSLVMDELADEGIDTTGTSININLEKLTISDITCYYNDRTLGARAKAYIPKITAKGALSDSLIQAQVVGSIQITNVDYDSTNAYKLKMAELKLDVDYKGEDVLMRDVTLSLDDIKIGVTGTARLSNEIYADLHLACDKIDLADVLKFAPDGLLDEFGVKQLEGKLHFSADVKGNVTDTTRYPHVEANLGFDNGLVLMTGYPKVKNIGLDVDLSTGSLDTDESVEVKLNKLHFETAKSSGTIKLTASNLNKPRYNVNAKFHVAIPEVEPFIPADLGISSIGGAVDLGVNTKGVFTGDVDDAFIEKALHNTSATLRLSNFNVTMDSVITVDPLNLNLAYSNMGITIDKTDVGLPEFGLALKNFGLDVKLGGSIFDLSKTTVDLRKMHVEIDDSKIDLAAKVKNLEMPTYEAEIGADVVIENFKQFFPDSLAYSMTGGVLANIKSHGTVNLDSIDTQMFDLIINNTDIDLKLSNINADMYDSFTSFNNLGGEVKIARDSILVDKLGIEWQGLNLHVDSTIVENAMKIFVLEQTNNKLKVLTKVGLDDFDYAWLDQMFPADSTAADSVAVADVQAGGQAEGETATAVAASANDGAAPAEPVAAAETAAVADTAYSFLALGYPVEVKGMFKLGHLQYGKSSIDTISAKFNVNDTLALIEHLRLGAFKGSLDASASIEFRSDSLMEVYFRTHFDKMDLKQLLVEFDNFDQTDVTSENLSGLMTADLDGYLDVINMGDSIPMGPLKVLGRLKLEDGAIKDMEVLKTLDRYVNMRELDNIQFQTLETSLFVRNGSLYLPQTDIKTTAMNLSLFAMQGMDNDNFEYHIKIFPGEIMAGNSKKVMKKQSQMKDNLANEDNMRSINLLAYDIDGESKYWFDTDNRKKKMRTKIKVQEKQLELGFNPRLVKYETGVKFR
ncbi:MAG: AsmA family protein [Salinivirgaceae bacterium]|nr:AsmA family protein [Salinivirgaceae bacterium]